VEIVLGLGAAVAYGAADFFGGLASRRTAALTVVLLSQAAGSLLLLVSWPLFSSGALDETAVGWGLLAGVCGSGGVTLLYLGLATGPMSLVAPVTAVIAAIVPVAFGLAAGERPGPLSLLGVGVALVAVVLVSVSGGEAAGRELARAGRRGIAAALAAGAAFGGFFIALERAADDSGLWPLVGARISSVGTVAILLLATSTIPRPRRGSMPAILAAGVLDVAANLLYVLATHRGLLSLVAVLTAMYPASTVLLARFVLGERLTRVRLVGLAAAAVGVVLIAS
jgi:drug/metabolite transporter (DMT)-like permease